MKKYVLMIVILLFLNGKLKHYAIECVLIEPHLIRYSELSPFYVAKTAVTQSQYFEIMKSNPSKFSGNDLPVENISWYEAIVFCNLLSIKEGLTPVYIKKSKNGFGTKNCEEWLIETAHLLLKGVLPRYLESSKSKLTDLLIKSQSPTYGKNISFEVHGYHNLTLDVDYVNIIPKHRMAIWQRFEIDTEADGYRLLTDSEWDLIHYVVAPEINEDIESYAWIYTNSSESTHPVGYKKPDKFGILDFMGNVLEWRFNHFGNIPPSYYTYESKESETFYNSLSYRKFTRKEYYIIRDDQGLYPLIRKDNIGMRVGRTKTI